MIRNAGTRSLATVERTVGWAPKKRQVSQRRSHRGLPEGQAHIQQATDSVSNLPTRTEWTVLGER